MLSSSSMWLVAAAIFVGVILAVEIGFQIGRRRQPKDADRADLGVVQGAVLGLLGLLLGFTFAGAGSRFVERQELIVREANAIGTAYLRADLLGEPYRGSIRSALQTYTGLRVAGGNEPDRAKLGEILARCEELHEQLWAAAREGVRERPAVLMAVVPAINEVIDLHTTRLAAARRHLPVPVMSLLLACAGLSLSVIGYSRGLDRQRSIGLVGTLAFVVGSAIWITIDLDYPRQGAIRLNDTPLLELKFSESPGPG